MPVGSGASPRARRLRERYLEALVREIRAAVVVEGLVPGEGLRTVSFGGGTPSLLAPEELGGVLDELRRAFGVAEGAEVSLEADPGTFDAEKAARWRELGITRLSVGVQSFDEGTLRTAGRTHGADEAREALGIVRAAGFESWSLDLISSLPRLTPALWEETLQAAIAEAPDHVSVYDLQIEQGTAFGRRYEAGVAPLPSFGTSADMYRAASRALTEAGYEHYEVSNYAMPGARSRHNLVYWQLEPYLAFGNGAASFLRGERYGRPRDLEKYFAYVDALEAGERTYGLADDAEDEGGKAEDTETEQLEEALMLGLRLADGVDWAALEARHGAAALAPLRVPARQLVADGLAELRILGGDWVAARGGEDVAWGEVQRLRLTDPEGFLLSNEAIATLFAAL